tara:strand:+ start:444 stop:590 length:147 start_codon:yes stop_codon:yes gene_type:complete
MRECSNKIKIYEIKLNEYEQLTAPNRMELIAVIEGIKSINRNTKIELI